MRRAAAASSLWGKRVVASLGGEGRSVSLIGSLLKLNRQGRFPFDKLIRAFPGPGERGPRAIPFGRVIKPVLRMPE